MNKLKNYMIFFIIPSILIMIIIFLVITILSTINLYNYESRCESFGGKYWETVNVTCEILYQNCFKNCNLNGIDYNFYDGDLCSLDCNYENKLNKGITCVC